MRRLLTPRYKKLLTPLGTRALAVGLILVIFGSALLVGGATQSTALAGILIVCLVALVSRLALFGGWNALSTLLLALSSWTLLSVIPVPLTFVSWLSPSTGAIWEQALEPLGEPPPSWVTLSLDPTASWLEVGKWGAYSIVAALAGRLTSIKGLQPQLIIVWGCVSSICLLALLHSFFGAQTLYGIYEPQMLAPGHRISPLLNPNNLAGFANLGALGGVAILANHRPSLPRSILGGGTVICIATTIMTASRGGIFSLLVGFVLIFLTWNDDLRRSRSKTFAFKYPALLLTTTLGGIAVGSLGLDSQLWRTVLNDDLSKIQILRNFVPGIQDYWSFGVGRGAFETLSERYLSNGGSIIFRSVENFLMSWAIEWGLVATSLVFLCFCWLLRPARMRLNASRTARIAWIAVFVLALQNLADIALELPSVCFAAFSVLGALEQSREHRVGQSPRPPEPLGSRLSQKWSSAFERILGLAPFVAAGLCITSFVVTLSHGPDAISMRRTLAHQLDSTDWKSPEEVALFKKNVRKARLQRPAEPYIAIAAAIGSLRSREEALPWAGAALKAAPHNARAHYATGLALHRRGALNQSLFQLKLAISADNQLTSHAVRLARSWTDDPKKLRRLVPNGEAGATTLVALARTFPRKERPHARRNFVLAAFERSPHSLAPNMMLGSERLLDLRTNTVPCKKDNSGVCALVDTQTTQKALLKNISQLLEKHADHCEGLRLQAQWMAINNNAKEAIANLNRGCNSCTGSLACFQDAVAMSQQPALRMERKLAETNYLGLACGSTQSCAKAEAWVAHLARSRKDWAQAHAHFLKAATLSRSATFWINAAQAAVRSGQLVRAETALQQAKALGSLDASVEAEVKKLRQDSLHRLLQ